MRFENCKYIHINIYIHIYILYINIKDIDKKFIEIKNKIRFLEIPFEGITQFFRNFFLPISNSK